MEATFTLAIALAAGVLAQCAARLVRIPSIVLLLALGVALGPEGAGWVRPGAFGGALFGILDFAIPVILFEGALNLDIRRLRREERVIRNLVTWGALVSLAGGAIAARVWLAWPWPLAFLFGAIVVVTGPTVVGPLVRGLRLRPRLQTMLEAEGVLIDPIGALLAVLVLQVVLAPAAMTLAGGLGELLLRLAFGVALGLLGGALMAQTLRLRPLVGGFENILALALVVLLFSFCEHWLNHSGLLAVTLAGVIVGNSNTPVHRDLREFKDQLTLLLIGVIFIILAADVGIADVRALGWAGVATLGSLVLVVRPLVVFAATARGNITGRERLFMASVAPRGIVAAAVASLTAVELAAENIAGGTELRAMVFLVIAGTVALAGGLAWPLGALLKVRLPGRDRVALVGAQGLGLELGRVLQAAGTDVVFVDSDPKRCRAAQEAGFAVIFDDALQERTLMRLRAELVGVAVGVTHNDHLNSLFVSYAMERFGVPRGLVALEALDDGDLPEPVRRPGVDVLFDGPHDQERWDVRWRHDEVDVEWFELQSDVAAESRRTGAPSVPEEVRQRDQLAFLAIKSGHRIAPMRMRYAPSAGDVAVVAIYRRQREEAVAALRGLGWRSIPAPERSARR